MQISGPLSRSVRNLGGSNLWRGKSSPRAYCVRPFPFERGHPATPRSMQLSLWCKGGVGSAPSTSSPEPSLPFAQAPLRQRCATAAYSPLGETQTVPAHRALLPPQACRHRVAHRAKGRWKLRTTHDTRLALASPSFVGHPEASITLLFVASPFCDSSYTMLGISASPPPSLHPSVMQTYPTPCAFESQPLEERSC